MVTNKVVWSEGMLLAPHHFQQQDRFYLYLFQQLTQTNNIFYSGFSELIIDENLLSSGKLSLIKASGIMKNGNFFKFPFQDNAPSCLEIVEKHVGQEIYLALPEQKAHCNETAFIDKEEYSPYKIESIDVLDSNVISSRQLITLQVAKQNFKLIAEEDICSEFSYLGIAKIKEIINEQCIILDENYIPPCRNIFGVSKLYSCFEEILSLINFRAKVISKRLSYPSQLNFSIFLDYIILKTLNHYESFLLHYKNIKNLHPHDFFIKLLTFISELSVIYKKEKKMDFKYLYHHFNLKETFSEIMAELREALNFVLEEKAISLLIEKKDEGLWFVMLSNKKVLDNYYFVIGISSTLPSEEIISCFPSQSKVAPVEIILDYVNRALPGIHLKPLHIVPSEIPYFNNFVYFSLQKDTSLWEQLRYSNSLAIHISGHFPSLQMQLWAIKELQ